MDAKEGALGDTELYPPLYTFPISVGGTPIASWDRFKEYTANEEDMQKVLDHLRNPVDYPVTGLSQKEAKLCKVLVLDDGILYFTGRGQNRMQEDKSLWRVYVPDKMRRTSLALAHNMPLGGHMGRDRLTTLMKKRFWWPDMNKTIDEYVDQCLRCKISKTPLPKNHGFEGEYPLVPEPFEHIHIDHVDGLPPSGPMEVCHVMTIVDRATNFMIAVPVPDLFAKTQARVLFDRVFCVFGLPTKITSDRGSAFKNKLNKHLSQRLGINWNFSTAQNPRSNGKIERMHRSLKATFRAFCSNQHDTWEAVLQPFVFAMNTAHIKKLRDFTPFELMFGRQPRIPLDLMANETKLRSMDETLANAMEMRHLAAEMIKARYESDQLAEDGISYSKKLRHVEFKEGEFVLLWNDSKPKGISRKLQPNWEGPYVVSRRTAAYNYAIIVRGKERIVHARRLFRYTPYMLPDCEADTRSRLEEAAKAGAAAFDEALARDEKLSLQGPTRESDRYLDALEDEQPLDLADGDIDLSAIGSPGLSDEEAKDEGLEKGKFYFLGKDKANVIFLVRLISVDPLRFHFYRSDEAVDKGKQRYFVPVWWDPVEKLEDWSERKDIPARYQPFDTVVRPSALFPQTRGFDLVDMKMDQEWSGGRIPAHAYNILDSWLKERKKSFPQLCDTVGGLTSKGSRVSSRTHVPTLVRKPLEMERSSEEQPKKKQRVTDSKSETIPASRHSMPTRSSKRVTVALVDMRDNILEVTRPILTVKRTGQKPYHPQLDECLSRARVVNEVYLATMS